MELLSFNTLITVRRNATCLNSMWKESGLSKSSMNKAEGILEQEGFFHRSPQY